MVKIVHIGEFFVTTTDGVGERDQGCFYGKANCGSTTGAGTEWDVCSSVRHSRKSCVSSCSIRIYTNSIPVYDKVD